MNSILGLSRVLLKPIDGFKRIDQRANYISKDGSHRWEYQWRDNHKVPNFESTNHKESDYMSSDDIRRYTPLRAPKDYRFPDYDTNMFKAMNLVFVSAFIGISMSDILGRFGKSNTKANKEKVAVSGWSESCSGWNKLEPTEDEPKIIRQPITGHIGHWGLGKPKDFSSLFSTKYTTDCPLKVRGLHLNEKTDKHSDESEVQTQQTKG